jgi:hypothetical protein
MKRQSCFSWKNGIFGQRVAKPYQTTKKRNLAHHDLLLALRHISCYSMVELWLQQAISERYVIIITRLLLRSRRSERKKSNK